MKKYINKDFLRIIISIILLLLSFFIKTKSYNFIILIISYIIISYEIYIKAYKNLKEGKIFDENFLMIIATIGSFFISSYEEAVMVMLLFEIGEYFGDLAVENSKKSITKLMDLRVDKINLLEDNKIVSISTEKAKIGDVFVVRPGEKIPLDGIVIKGSSYLDTSSLTGESHPKKVAEKDRVLSGCINKDSILEIKATTTYKTSTSAKIIELIDNSNEKKSKTETFIHKFSKIYTPIVVLLAFLILLIPSLLGYDFKVWLYRALVFLVTSCPCALVISVPLGYFCGIGRSSKEGILIKGSKELENLSDMEYLLLDKTGTITEGIFEITKINSKKLSQDKFLEIVASAEENSIHPIATIIKEKASLKKPLKVKKYQEISGKGISCIIEKDTILIGNKNLLEDNKIEVDKVKEIGTIIHLAINNVYQGYLVISDKIKESSKQLVNSLKQSKIKDIVMLSGDEEQIVKLIAKETGIKTYFGNLLPIDKVNKVEEYKEKGKVMFIGDGINDAPVIKMADLGVSMGQIGSDAAIEASDIVLMNDDLLKIKKAIIISKLTKQKVIQSIIFALTIKILVLLLGIFGISTIWMAVFADVGVTFIAILNVLTIFLKKI